MPDKVELSLVWSFTCPTCKHVNYHHGTAKGLTDEERRDAAAILGDGDLMTCPIRVWCVKCESVFDVDMPDES